MLVRDAGCCWRPAKTRLALFDDKAELECYADSYVKCFWRLCDRQHSVDSFRKPDNAVIVEQPPHQNLPYKTPGIIQTVLMRN